MAKRRRQYDEKKRHKGERHARREYLDRDRDRDLDANKSMKKSYHTSRASGTHDTDKAIVIVAIVCIIAVMGGYFLYLNYDTMFDPEADSDDEPIDLDDNLDIIPNPNNNPGNNNIPPFTPSNPANSIVIMEIKDYGVVVIELFDQRAPVTAKNFLDLANQGRYNGNIFHRVIDNFMIQGGDFTNNDGTGGHAAEYHQGLGNPSDPNTWLIPDEFDPELKNVPFTLSMANRGPDTGGSQFFINTVNNNHLDNKHAVFGEVIAGIDIVNAISTCNVDGERPVPNVVMNRVYEYTGPIVS